MSSSATIISFQYLTQQVYLYGGFFIFITGVIGELLNILIFTTLKTFRKTPCGFYLTIVSIANFGQVVLAVLIRTLNYGLNIDLLQSSWICKIREFSVPFFALMAFTSICLAIIDQFLSLIRPHWNNLHLAHQHIALICFIWFGHNIPYLIYCDVSSSRCTNLNVSFANYVNYFIWPVLLGCLPIVIMIIFSILTFYNVRIKITNQRNIVRLSHDRQLTAMTLVYVIFSVILTIPCIIFSIFTFDLVNITAEQSARNRLIYSILSILYYESNAVSNVRRRGN
jgi:hypothetical protein